MKTKAFTLVELLVVIAIIGIISTIAYTQIHSARYKAQKAVLQEMADSIMKTSKMCDNLSHVMKTGAGIGTLCPIQMPGGWAPVIDGGNMCDELDFTWPTRPDFVTGGMLCNYSDANRDTFQILFLTSGGHFSIFTEDQGETLTNW